VTSAFIIQVHTQVQRDPDEDTVALFRVLIDKIDNTTFGGDTPALPQWTGPPWTVVQVQCILCTSLAASLLSAFFAMLGKQWLNRYTSVDIRGSTIERSQNRQRKLDGIVAWHFNLVLECMPLMLQASLFLLGCALSRYLWEISTTIAFVVVGMTSFSVLFYLSILVLGVTSDDCPYQTPLTPVIRYLIDLIVSNSAFCGLLLKTRGNFKEDKSPSAILKYPLRLLLAFAKDIFQFVQAVVRSLVIPANKAYNRLFPKSPRRALGHQATDLDFCCISWMLRTSSDKTINLLTLEFLKTIVALPGIKHSVIVGCFNIFQNCFFIGGNNTTMITRGSEQLAETSAMCFFRAFYNLLVEEPTSTITKDLHQRYKRIFPPNVRLVNPSCPVITGALYHLFAQSEEQPDITWTHYNPSPDELTSLAHTLAQVTQFEHRRGEYENHEVPPWLVSFALRFLSQDPLPPTSVIIDCLTIIAADLGCDASDIKRVVSDEKCVHTLKMTISPLTLHQYAARRSFQIDNQ
jgi:hypothetical protein